MGEDLVVEVKVPFALDQDGPGGGVKILQGGDQAQTHGFLEAEEGSGRGRDPYFTEFVEEVDKHGSGSSTKEQKVQIPISKFQINSKFQLSNPL
jgi:hypothetical protein